jgi:hypothetical protein
MQELARCMDRDFMAIPVRELAEAPPDTQNEAAVFQIEYHQPDADSSQGYYTKSHFYTISPSYTETLAWLERYLPH